VIWVPHKKQASLVFVMWCCAVWSTSTAVQVKVNNALGTNYWTPQDHLSRPFLDSHYSGNLKSCTSKFFSFQN